MNHSAAYRLSLLWVPSHNTTYFPELSVQADRVVNVSSNFPYSACLAIWKWVQIYSYAYQADILNPMILWKYKERTGIAYLNSVVNDSILYLLLIKIHTCSFIFRVNLVQYSDDHSVTVGLFCIAFYLPSLLWAFF